MIEILGAHAGVQLALFPELYLTGYQLADLGPIAREAEAQLERIREAARAAGAGVVVGAALPTAGGGVSNSALCISAAGELVGRYDKTQLFGAEREVFEPGNEVVLAQMGAIRVAPLICFDLEFPSPARIAARAGADLLVVISANMRPYHRDHRVFCEARALENRLPLAYVNRVGRESGFIFVGGSRLVGGDGRAYVQMSASREQVGVFQLVVAQAVPSEVDYLSQSRDDLEVRM